VHDLGDTVVLRFEIRDATGVLTTPAATAVALALPDGTINTSQSLASSAVGIYELSYVPTQSGRHIVRVTATAPGVAIVDQFDVRPTYPAYLVSVADVKARLNIDVTDYSNDEELRSVIEAATLVVERHLRQVVARRTVVEVVTAAVGPGPNGYWVGIADLSFTPVLDLTSVVSLDGLTTWPPANLRVSGSMVYAATGLGLYGALTVTYTAGSAIVPANYAQAALEIVANLWSSQRLSSLGPRPFGGYGGATGEESLPGLAAFGFAIPNKAVELLGARPPLVG
jgi:hypothetical protein